MRKGSEGSLPWSVERGNLRKGFCLRRIAYLLCTWSFSTLVIFSKKLPVERKKIKLYRGFNYLKFSEQ